jgi:cell wall-associated NlpC family hydrolase
VNILKSRIRTIIALCVVAALVLGIGAPALASTLSDKRAQAAAVQAKVNSLIDKQEVASEQYNNARDKYLTLSAQVAATRRRIAQLQANTAKLQTALGNQADAMYRENGMIGFLTALLNARNFDDFDSTMQFIQRLGEQNAATIEQLKVSEQETMAQQQRLVVAQSDAATQQAAMAANAAAVRARLSDQQHLLATISKDIKKILAQQAAAEAAAAAARARALRSSSGSGGGFDPGGNPPTSSKGAAAVWWAEKALGRPYQWGATGPNSFDCSGLVKWAYGHVGINLPHYSGAQIGVGSRVARANLEPGDLVFFGSPIHHVGMYVGGGDFIEAPYTGANVRISSLGGRGDYAGACRP